jgi:integrase
MKERAQATFPRPSPKGIFPLKLTTQIARELALPAGKSDHFEWDDTVGGFGLRLRQRAKGIMRSWCYQYDIGIKTRRMTIGSADVISADAARRLAGKLQAEVRLGQDPAAKKTEARTAAAETMAATLATYLPIKRANLRPRSYGELERHLLKNCRSLHQHQLRKITPAAVSARYEKLAAENGATTANNTWRSLHAFFDWCLRQGLLDRNPAIGVERRKDNKRDRVLSATEIKALWQATDDASDYSAILRLLLLSGCRASEIAGLRWDEIFSDRIVLPAERVKNNRMHMVPLTPAMRAILDPRERRGEFVFGRAIDRPFTGWGASKEALDTRLKAARTKMKPWVTHDLRRTASTGMGELGIAPHVIEAALNHVSGFRHGVAGVYNLSQLEAPIRHALATWNTHVMEIVEGRVHGDRVVPLRAS